MQIGKARAVTTEICIATADAVEVRGKDLCGDLMGRLSFTEYFYLLLTGREPTEDRRYFLDLLLVAIAEHEQQNPIGFVLAGHAEAAVSYSAKGGT